MRLPKQDKTYGHYLLPDGSRIYQSGSGHYPVHPGWWLIWAARGTELTSEGKRVSVGDVLLGKGGILYFSSAQEALNALEEYQSFRAAK